MITFGHEQFGVLALQVAGYDDKTIERTNTATNTNRLKDFCYAGTKTILDIFHAIQNPSLGECRIAKPDPTHLIWSLYFLKKYPTVHDLAARCSGTEKTVLARVWRYARAIQALKETKIEWIFDADADYQEYFILSVDGVHCRIYEPRTQPSSGWWSKKFNKAALTYEIGVAIHHNKIVWINGPFPAGQNDIKVFRKDLKSKIPDGRRAIGDKGYRGEPSKVSTKNKFDSDEMNLFSRRIRARHETVNSRLKSFEILSGVFRSKGNARLEKHKTAFEACCVIVQFELDNGSSLFTV